MERATFNVALSWPAEQVANGCDLNTAVQMNRSNVLS